MSDYEWSDDESVIHYAGLGEWMSAFAKGYGLLPESTYSITITVEVDKDGLMMVPHAQVSKVS